MFHKENLKAFFSDSQKTRQKGFHSGMSEEGLMVLDDNQLESISGGNDVNSHHHNNHGANVLHAAQAQLAAAEVLAGRSVNVTDINTVNNTALANTQTVGQGSTTTNIKK